MATTSAPDMEVSPDPMKSVGASGASATNDIKKKPNEKDNTTLRKPRKLFADAGGAVRKLQVSNVKEFLFAPIDHGDRDNHLAALSAIDTLRAIDMSVGGDVFKLVAEHRPHGRPTGMVTARFAVPLDPDIDRLVRCQFTIIWIGVNDIDQFMAFPVEATVAFSELVMQLRYAFGEFTKRIPADPPRAKAPMMYLS